jgi:hypothetical protein
LSWQNPVLSKLFITPAVKPQLPSDAWSFGA